MHSFYCSTLPRVIGITVYFVLLQIHNEGLNSSWIGYMTGQVDFHTNIINSKTTAIMKLKSKNDHSKHTIFTGGLYMMLIFISVVCICIVQYIINDEGLAWLNFCEFNELAYFAKLSSSKT